jgi:hypothetical protein
MYLLSHVLLLVLLLMLLQGCCRACAVFQGAGALTQGLPQHEHCEWHSQLVQLRKTPAIIAQDNCLCVFCVWQSQLC